MKEYFIELYRLYENKDKSQYFQDKWDNAIVNFAFGAFIGVSFAALIIWALIVVTKVMLIIFGIIFGLFVFFWLAIRIPVFIGKHLAAKEEN